MSEHHVDTCVLFFLVVNEDILFSDAVFADCDDFKLVAVETQTFISLLTEDERFAVFELHLHIVADVLACDVFVNAVRENHTVLEHLDD